MAVNLTNPIMLDKADHFQLALDPRGKTLHVQWREGYERVSDGKFMAVHTNGYTFLDGDVDGTPVTEYTDILAVATQDGEALGQAIQRVVRAALKQKECI